MSIKYVVGDVTEPEGDGNRIVIHCCNNEGKMGSGVALALYTKWSKVRTKYLDWYKTGKPYRFELGNIQWVKVEYNMWVVNLLGQAGLISDTNPTPVRYSKIEEGFEKVKKDIDPELFTIHMPRIGCGLAGGDWRMMEPIIEKAFDKFDVFIYDLPTNKEV